MPRHRGGVSLAGSDFGFECQLCRRVEQLRVEGQLGPQEKGSHDLCFILSPAGMGPRAGSSLLSACGGSSAWLNWGGCSRREGPVRRKGLQGTGAHSGEAGDPRLLRRTASPGAAACTCDIHLWSVTSCPGHCSHVRGGELLPFAMPVVRMFSAPSDCPQPSALILRLAGGEKPEAGNR